MNLQDLPPWLMNVGGFALLLFLLKREVKRLDDRPSEILAAVAALKEDVRTKLDQLLASIHAIDTWKAVADQRINRVEADVNALHARVSKLISDKIDGLGGE